MKKILLTLYLGSLILFYSYPVFAEKTYEGLQGPTEVRYWDETNAHNGYTLFGAFGNTYLIDMEGHIINTWETEINPRLLDYNGNILDLSRGDVVGLVELDWEGNVVFEYVESRPNYIVHHDCKRIFNKQLNEYTTLFIANKKVSSDAALAAGADPANGPYNNVQMDAIVEVDMNGNVVWEWWFFNHVIQDIDSTKANYVGEGKTITDYPNRININLPGKPLKRDWLHCNSVDYNPELGHVVINSVHGEFYVIDHDGTFVPRNPQASIDSATTSKGDFLYRFGDPARYSQGDPPSISEDWTRSSSGHKQIGGSHDVHWIKPGLPGAGNFLIFNNGHFLYDMYQRSWIFEVNPYLNADSLNTGNYVNPPDAGYWEYENFPLTRRQSKTMSRQIEWFYTTVNHQGFFSTVGSGAQRLQNGNTFICSDDHGHLFEVTAEGDLVWEYISPVTKDGNVEVLQDAPVLTNAVFRAYRYSADHPSLAGRDLTPMGTITGKDPDYLKPEDLTNLSDLPTSKVFKLNQNYPNPFNQATVIPFDVLTPGDIKLTIFNINGQAVKTIVNEKKYPGSYIQAWDGKNSIGENVSTGVYIYKLQIGDHIKIRKMALMR
jgi:hypothetical protein